LSLGYVPESNHDEMDIGFMIYHEVAYIVASADEDNGLNIQLCLVSMEGNNVWGEEE
jgi:hypothetical protein